MRDRSSVCVVSVTVMLGATALGMGACAKDSPTTPTVSIGAPSPASPANGAQIANLSQPVTLVVQNTATTATGVTYTFEVATDSAFASKVQVKSGVAQNTSGQTAVTLDTLLAARDYFWHAQATASGTTGAFGSTFTFTLGAVISISAPVPVSPLSGAVTIDRPQLTVANAAKAGPAGAITYRFEVADNTGFNPVLFTSTVAEGSGQTSVTPATSLSTGRTLFWRATALDSANSLSSAASTAQSFTANPASAAGLIAQRQGVVLWPGTQPPGASGRASLGPGWGVGTLRDFMGNQFSSPPLEVLRVFDLIDRGMDPDPAIGWMKSNGYPTVAVWYPSVAAIGFPAQYMALIAGSWELVLRVGA